MRIPFNIKYRPQIESGEYKVVTTKKQSVRIICWDRSTTYWKIVALVLAPDGKTENPFTYDVNGNESDGCLHNHELDLFIITPGPELSEFEKALEVFLMNADSSEETFHEEVKKHAAELLSLARDQFIKDGYVIEKKAFHDAVEKVAPEVMKEVLENVDKTKEELTEFEKELESFYNHHLQVCTYDNQGTVEDSLHGGASKLIAIARKELFEQIIDDLKKLPGLKEDESHE